MTVAETMPFASEVDEELLSETDAEGCHTTATLGTGLPAPSSTRATSWAGNSAPGAPV